jgi:hypothetical protein
MIIKKLITKYERRKVMPMVAFPQSPASPMDGKKEMEISK